MKFSFNFNFSIKCKVHPDVEGNRQYQIALMEFFYNCRVSSQVKSVKFYEWKLKTMVEIPSVACASKKKAFHLLWKDLCFKVPVAYKLASVAIALFKTSCILQRVSLFKRGLSSWQSGI